MSKMNKSYASPEVEIEKFTIEHVFTNSSPGEIEENGGEIDF
jgi:hypothetical protein